MTTRTTKTAKAGKAASIAASAAAVLSLMLVVPANAQSHDYFSHMTPPQATQKPEDHPLLGSMAMGSARTPIVSWFETYDTTVFTLRVSDQDKALLKKPFEKKSERVQEWTDTAQRVAKNYRLLALTIKRMPVPPNSPGVSQYRNLTADWYSDVAAIYEDLTRPHRPPKTKEEFDAQLDEIQQRSESLAGERQKLKEMDTNLRKTFMVHASRETDALIQYVTGK